MDRVYCIKSVVPLQDSLILATESPGIPSPHLIDLEG